uniref:Uncharacterized protein n=1 Tax=Ditylenchus dipsaci TaxID=166011 RepID=A0A915D6X3_9BILA
MAFLLHIGYLMGFSNPVQQSVSGNEEERVVGENEEEENAVLKIMTKVEPSEKGPPRRAAFTPEEDKAMWEFFAQKIRKGNPDAIARRASIWVEYAMKSGTKRTFQALEKHFRHVLLTRIDNAPIDNEDVILILEQCKLCELTIVRPSLFVEKVYRVGKKSKKKAQPLSSAIPDLPPPILVQDTQLEPEEEEDASITEIEGDLIVVEQEEDEVVNESFHSVDPNKSVENDEDYLKFISGVGSKRQKTKCEGVIQLEQSPPKKYYARKTADLSSDSSEYTMDLSDGPSPLQKFLEEQSESSCAAVEEPAQNQISTSLPEISIIPSTQAPVEDKSKESRSVVLEEKKQPVRIVASYPDDTVTQIELDWHEQLTQKNRENPGATPLEILQYKELLRLRIKLIAQKLLPVDVLMDGIPIISDRMFASWKIFLSGV